MDQSSSKKSITTRIRKLKRLGSVIYKQISSGKIALVNVPKRIYVGSMKTCTWWKVTFASSFVHILHI